MAWSAASARALLAASPIALVEPPAIGERITEWLKITAVPLLVFLIGTCTWGCLKNTAAWRVLTEDGGGSAHNELPDEVRSDSPRAISNNEAAKGEQKVSKSGSKLLAPPGGSEAKSHLHTFPEEGPPSPLPVQIWKQDWSCHKSAAEMKEVPR